MPKYDESIITQSRTLTSMNLEPAIKFISSLIPGSRVQLPLEENETSRETMRILNAAADSVGIKIFRVGIEGNILKFRIVKTRTTDAIMTYTKKGKVTEATK